MMYRHHDRTDMLTNPPEHLAHARSLGVVVFLLEIEACRDGVESDHAKPYVMLGLHPHIDLLKILKECIAKDRDGHPQDRQISLNTEVFFGGGNARLHVLAALGSNDKRAHFLVYGTAKERFPSSQCHSHCNRNEALPR